MNRRDAQRRVWESVARCARATADKPGNIAVDAMIEGLSPDDAGRLVRAWREVAHALEVRAGLAQRDTASRVVYDANQLPLFDDEVMTS